MLVLTRKRGEPIVIDGSIVVTVLNVQGNRVRIGVQAPPNVAIVRQELRDKNKEVVSDQHVNADLLSTS